MSKSGILGILEKFRSSLFGIYLGFTTKQSIPFSQVTMAASRMASPGVKGSRFSNDPVALSRREARKSPGDWRRSPNLTLASILSRTKQERELR
jgi:hypothetical protein